MSRLLAVSWAMPPMLTPRALQVPLTLKYLARLGWEITVISSNHQPPWKAMRYDPALLMRYQNEHFRTVSVESPERSLFLRAMWRYVFTPIPDNQRPWSRRAVQVALRELRTTSYDAILSFAVPWSDHLVGLELHQQTSLPWIAHFSDPWVDSPYYSKKGRVASIHRELEEAVIREANRVVFITEQTVNLVMKKYPHGWRQKVCVIPHGFDPETHEAQPVTELGAEQKRMKLVYTGTFYGPRSPVPLFHALQKLRETTLLENYIEVILVGQVPEKYGYQRLAHELGLDSMVQFMGVLPYAQSQAIINTADVLLVIDAPNLESSVFLPSKLVDYLPFQKPILGITPLRGASAELIQRLGCPAASPDDAEAITSILIELIKEWQIGQLKVGAEFQAVAAEYDIHQTARQLDMLLREVNKPL